jgi:hypothetical protein
MDMGNNPMGNILTATDKIPMVSIRTTINKTQKF